MINTSTLQLVRLVEPIISADDARHYASRLADAAADMLVNAERVRRDKGRGSSERVKSIEQRAERFQAMCEELLAAARAEDQRNPPYRSELTPAGEQLVIPGCERNLAPAARQLDLF